MRVNGLSKPLNALQVLTWVLFPYFIGGYTILSFIPQISVPSDLPSTGPGWDAQNYILGSLIYALSFLGIYSGGQACSIDPIDNHLQTHLRTNPNGRSKGGEGKTFCWVCQVHVSSKSKHCRFCEKCVHEFDHHCQWLNTCVGGKNYRHFFRCVCAVFAFTSLELVGFAVLLARFYLDGVHGGVRYRITSLYGGGQDSVVFAAFAISYAAVLLVTVGMIAQLFFFHVNLQRRGITTYDYV
ncbi:hypothetical protein TrRE_jg3512, partial [Triparma retinervis]